MKCLLRISIFLFVLKASSQVDYSGSWEDYLSYNQVVDFVKHENVVYAITENASFTYNINTEELIKSSSVNGLSGHSTSAVCYSSENKKLVIGYTNGLLDIVDENQNVKKIIDIFFSEISTEKGINSILEHENKIYLAMDFGVVVYDIKDLEFGDTYFIGENSSSVKVNDVNISNGFIYAATEDGVYIADYSLNLNDSNNWTKTFSGDCLEFTKFNNDLLVSRGNSVHLIDRVPNETPLLTVLSNIISIDSNDLSLSLATTTQGFVYDVNYNLDISTGTIENVTISSICSDEQNIYLGTVEKGILKGSFLTPTSLNEYHPEGPVSNDIFSITVSNEDLWVLYGKYDNSYSPNNFYAPIDHFNGDSWFNIAWEELGPIGYEGPWVEDLVNLTVDPNDKNRVYVSSWGAGTGEIASIDKGGMMIIENNIFYDFWHSENSSLSTFNVPNTNYYTSRIGSSVFDKEGNLWILNSLIYDGSGALKKMNPNGEWSGHELVQNGDHFDAIAADNNNIWVGSKSNGLQVYNEDGDKKAQLTTQIGGLPHNNVRSIGVGIDGDIWIGTNQGLVVFSDVDNVFTQNFNDAEPVIIEENGVASILLDGAKIDDILVDGSGNIWFATDGGVLKTNPSGKTTLNRFNTDNSPLPSNTILSLALDESTGKVYFGTDRGVVSFKTDISSYGEQLSDAYAYPNPALKQNNVITIKGRTTDFPLGTNIKIIDVAGNLVYESNAIVSQSTIGGKFLWDKRNLAGEKVASGVYIVVLYHSENKQTASTKIAIIN